MRGDIGEKRFVPFFCGTVILRTRGSRSFPSVENFSSFLTWAAFKSLTDAISDSKLWFPTTTSLKLPPSKFEGFSLSVLFHIHGIWVAKSACSLQTVSPLPYYSWLRSSNNKHLTSGMPFPFGLLSRLHEIVQFIWIQGNQLPQGSVVSLMQDWSPPLTFFGKEDSYFIKYFLCSLSWLSLGVHDVLFQWSALSKERNQGCIIC